MVLRLRRTLGWWYLMLRGRSYIMYDMVRVTTEIARDFAGCLGDVYAECFVVWIRQSGRLYAWQG